MIKKQKHILDILEIKSKLTGIQVIQLKQKILLLQNVKILL